MTAKRKGRRNLIRRPLKRNQSPLSGYGSEQVHIIECVANLDVEPGKVRHGRSEHRESLAQFRVAMEVEAAPRLVQGERGIGERRSARSCREEDGVNLAVVESCRTDVEQRGAGLAVELRRDEIGRASCRERV